jgi:hypothetical protein
MVNMTEIESFDMNFLEEDFVSIGGSRFHLPLRFFYMYTYRLAPELRIVISTGDYYGYTKNVLHIFSFMSRANTP